MKERPMIFNAEMVRAILDGRKTQTRRMMKNQPVLNGNLYEVFGAAWSKGMTSVPAVPGHSLSTRCPFGEVGDRIWVRETFQGPLIPEDELSEFLGANPDKFESPAYCEYAADGGPRPEYVDADDNTRHGWRPAIHMPRWASRITLEITGVRVERLNSISEQDALSEGIDAEKLYDSQDNYDCIADHNFTGRPSAVGHFSYLWQSIYGEESWQSNPWVWVIEFKRIEGGAA